MVGCILLGTTVSSIAWTLPKFLIFLVCIPFATLIYTSLKIATASIAFWTKQSGAMIYIFYMFNDFAKYPIFIYNSLLRWLISFIVPFAFTAYYPASYFLQGKNGLFNIGGLILISLVFFLHFLETMGQGPGCLRKCWIVREKVRLKSRKELMMFTIEEVKV